VVPPNRLVRRGTGSQSGRRIQLSLVGGRRPRAAQPVDQIAVLQPQHGAEPVAAVFTIWLLESPRDAEASAADATAAVRSAGVRRLPACDVGDGAIFTA